MILNISNITTILKGFNVFPLICMLEKAGCSIESCVCFESNHGTVWQHIYIAQHVWSRGKLSIFIAYS